MVFETLSKFNLKISLSKCVFSVPEIDFLGYNISTAGIKPTTSKLSELNDFPTPNDSKYLRRFLGMAGFYRKLVPNFATLAYPLTECIRLNPKSKSLQLSKSEEIAFTNIKGVLSNKVNGSITSKF